MTECRLISSFLRKTFSLLKSESIYPRSFWQGAPQRFHCFRRLHDSCVCGEHVPNPPAHPEGKGKKGDSSSNAGPRWRAPTAPQCLWWWDRWPQPHRDQQSCRQPAYPWQELFSHFVTNLTEETYFRSTISASYLSWPGWKTMFLQWVLYEKQLFKACPRNSIYMFYQYCHAACRKYIFTWQRQVAVLPTALNTRTKNTELLTHMNSPHMHLLEKFPSYFPQQMKKNPHWTYPFILLNKQQSKKPCQCTSLPHFSSTAVLFLCCQGYLILTLLPFFVACFCFEGVLLLLFLYF